MQIAKGKRNKLLLSVNRTVGSDEKRRKERCVGRKGGSKRSVSGHTEGA